MKRVALTKHKAVDQLVCNYLTQLFGDPEKYTDRSWRWTTGGYTLTYSCASLQEPDFRTRSWLACRQLTRREWLDENGYVRPRKECEGWNSFCSYPSGKYNLHFTEVGYTDLEWVKKELDRHLRELGL